MSQAPSNITIDGVFTDGRFSTSDQAGSVSGDYVFTGSDFAKDTDPVFENFESSSLGAAPGTIGPLTLSDPTYQAITNAFSVSGTKSLTVNFSDSAFPGNYLTLDGSQRELYACLKQRLEGDPADATVWKMWRVGCNEVYGGDPHAGESWTVDGTGMPSGFGGEITTGEGDVTSWADQNQATPGAESAYAVGEWQFLEIDFDAGTQKAGVCDVTGGVVVTRVSGTLFTEFEAGDNILVGLDTREVQSVTNGDVLVLETSVSNGTGKAFASADCHFTVSVNGTPTFIWENRAFGDFPTWLLIPCQGVDGSPDLNVYWDEVYCDESRTRLVFTDSATYASSTKFDIQILNSDDVTETAIGISGNTPSFTSGQTLHAHYWQNGTYQYLGTKEAV